MLSGLTRHADLDIDYCWRLEPVPGVRSLPVSAMVTVGPNKVDSCLKLVPATWLCSCIDVFYLRGEIRIKKS